jgi:hypothetical protein
VAISFIRNSLVEVRGVARFAPPFFSGQAARRGTFRDNYAWTTLSFTIETLRAGSQFRRAFENRLLIQALRLEAFAS